MPFINSFHHSNLTIVRVYMHCGLFGPNYMFTNKDLWYFHVFIYREANRQVERRFSKFLISESVVDNGGGCGHRGGESSEKMSSCWVPHPRTGIYVPKGHEQVIDDVPEGAASFNRTYWLREVDGVEKPDPDLPSDCYLHI